MVRRLSLLTALASLAIPASASAQAGCPGANAVPSAKSMRGARAATLCLLNQERRSHGLRALRADRHLSRAATAYSRSMVRHRFFDHVSHIDGSTVVQRVRRVGYLNRVKAPILGENLAWGTGARATPAQTVNAWMHSAGHRRNILTARFHQIGIGIAAGVPATVSGAANGAATYTTDFGGRG